MVRETTRRGCLSMRSRALGRLENSWYASSATTMASVLAHTWSKTSSGTVVPVGLFGVVMSTTVGRCSAMASRMSGASRVWSACRGTVTYSVQVLRAYSGYIE